MKGFWEVLSPNHFLKSNQTAEFILEEYLGGSENFSVTSHDGIYFFIIIQLGNSYNFSNTDKNINLDPYVNFL